MKLRYLPLAVTTALVLAGCAESQLPDVTGEGSIQGINAIVDGPEVTFRIEERTIESIGFKSATAAQAFDDLTYRFNFDGALPGDEELRRLASRSLAVVPDTDYVFVLTGRFDDAEILLWESPERQWEGDEEIAEVSAGHLSTDLAGVDFYLVAPGDPPAAGNARGSLDFGERLENFDVESGDYQVVLTPAGDASTILFRSVTQALGDRTTTLYAVHEADPSITSPISVRRVTASGSSEVAEANTRATRRYFHAALETAGVDVYADEDFDAPLAADVTFGEVTADIPIPRGETTYTYTAAGNVGAVLLESDDTLGVSGHVTSFLIPPDEDEEDDELAVLDLADDRRPVVGTVKVRIALVATNFEDVDIYLRPAGTDIADVGPSFPAASAPTNTGYARLEPGEYEITVTAEDDKTPLAPVLSLDLAEGDIAEVAIFDTVDPDTVEVVRYD